MTEKTPTAKELIGAYMSRPDSTYEGAIKIILENFQEESEIEYSFPYPNKHARIEIKTIPSEYVAESYLGQILIQLHLEKFPNVLPFLGSKLTFETLAEIEREKAVVEQFVRNDYK